MGGGVGKDRLQEGYEWGGGGGEPRRIGSRKDMSGGGGGREPRRIGCRRDMSGGSSKTAGSQSLRVIFCN